MQRLPPEQPSRHDVRRPTLLADRRDPTRLTIYTPTTIISRAPSTRTPAPTTSRTFTLGRTCTRRIWLPRQGLSQPTVHGKCHGYTFTARHSTTDVIGRPVWPYPAYDLHPNDSHLTGTNDSHTGTDDEQNLHFRENVHTGKMVAPTAAFAAKSP